MDLWIRTQDKMRLVKPNRLAIKRDSRTIGEGDYYIYESQNSLRYGTYKTKERALEITRGADFYSFLLGSGFIQALDILKMINKKGDSNVKS